jgi:hypothetical protein
VVVIISRKHIKTIRFRNHHMSQLKSFHIDAIHDAWNLSYQFSTTLQGLRLSMMLKGSKISPRMITGVIRPRFGLTVTNKTLKTPALSASPACADEVSPEVSIGAARTRFLQQ